MQLFEEVKQGYQSGNLVSSDVGDYIEKLIFNTSLNNSQYSGYCKYALRVKRVYDDGIGTMAVCLVKGVGLTISISPRFCMTGCENGMEILACISHEILHILYSHLSLYFKNMQRPVSSIITNLSCDAEINKLLPDIPKDSVTDKTINNILNPDVGYRFTARSRDYTSSDYYAWFNDTLKSIFGTDILETEYVLDVSGKGISFKDEIICLALNEKVSVLEIIDGQHEKAVAFARALLPYLDMNTVMVELQGYSLDEVEDGDDLEGLFGSIQGELFSLEGAFSELGDSLDNAMRSRGDGSSGKSTFLKSTLGVTNVPWNVIIKSTCKSKVLGGLEPTKRKINRRQPFRLELSGKKKEETFKLVIAIDESGSISMSEYNKFLREIEKIISQFPCELTLLRFTIGIEEVLTCNTRSRKDTRKFFQNINNSRHNGGTLFRPIFEYLNEKRFPKDTLVVVLTDGGGERMVDFLGYTCRKWVMVDSPNYMSVRNESKKNVLSMNP